MQIEIRVDHATMARGQTVRCARSVAAPDGLAFVCIGTTHCAVCRCSLRKKLISKLPSDCSMQRECAPSHMAGCRAVPRSIWLHRNCKLAYFRSRASLLECRAALSVGRPALNMLQPNITRCTIASTRSRKQFNKLQEQRLAGTRPAAHHWQRGPSRLKPATVKQSRARSRAVIGI